MIYLLRQVMILLYYLWATPKASLLVTLGLAAIPNHYSFSGEGNLTASPKYRGVCQRRGVIRKYKSAPLVRRLQRPAIAKTGGESPF